MLDYGFHSVSFPHARRHTKRLTIHLRFWLLGVEMSVMPRAARVSCERTYSARTSAASQRVHGHLWVCHACKSVWHDPHSAISVIEQLSVRLSVRRFVPRRSTTAAAAAGGFAAAVGRGPACFRATTRHAGRLGLDFDPPARTSN